ncbi:response regulator transcription factor [Magnetovirga frankeli]|uniref:response regulator transcription factor n=1 Tax=Magnetovirga frankeli TaxID=947516 RepID=UPI001293F263|nr:response regulator transcription factor [gamma proteobacterium SS-5]
MKILFVEDNIDFRDEISYQLGHLGYQVIALDQGQDLLDWLDSHPAPPILLLDLGLPDIDGLDLCRQLRRDYPSMIIIILTARGEADQRVEGWEAGAHAYLTKPVYFKELQVVLANQQQRLGQHEQPSSGCWRLEVQTGWLVSPQGQGGEITFIESQLLQGLAGQDGQPVSRDALVRALGEQP